MRTPEDFPEGLALGPFRVTEANLLGNSAGDPVSDVIRQRNGCLDSGSVLNRDQFFELGAILVSPSNSVPGVVVGTVHD